jgi:hypothetical protein
MRESPSGFALNFGLVPIRMFTPQDAQNDRSGVTPHSMGNCEALRRSFLLENFCHYVIDDVDSLWR